MDATHRFGGIGGIAPLKMKSLSPIAIVALGPALVGAVSVAVVAFRLPESQTAPSILLLFLIGAAVGAVCFGPIAMAIVVRAHLTERTTRFARRVLGFTSVVALVSLGYLVALLRHDVRDSPTALALVSLLAFLGTLVSISLATVLRPTDDHAAAPRMEAGAVTPSEGDGRVME